MVGEYQRGAPIIANAGYMVDLGYHFLIRFCEATVLYPVYTGLASHLGLVGMAAVGQILREVVETGDVFFHGSESESRERPKVGKICESNSAKGNYYPLLTRFFKKQKVKTIKKIKPVRRTKDTEVHKTKP